MKKSRIYSVLVVVFILGLISFSSCKKEEEEPSIVGEWTITKYREEFKFAGKVIRDTTIYVIEGIHYDKNFSEFDYYWSYENWKFNNNNTLNLLWRDVPPTDTNYYVNEFDYTLFENNTMKLVQGDDLFKLIYMFYNVKISQSELSFVFSDLGPDDPNAYNTYIWLKRK